MSSGSLIDVGRRPIVVGVATCGLAFYVAYYVTKFRLSALWPMRPRGDAAIIFDVSQRIFAQTGYPADTIFPYPPSAVLMFYSLGTGGPVLFMSVWYALMAAGLILSLRASLVQERPGVQAVWLVIGLFGILLTDWPIDWDLRNANSNLIYLGLVMAGYGLLGTWPIIAGTLIGVSVSLKLYSALLLLWLFVNGQRRAVGAAAATILTLWITVPALLFGAGGAANLYSGWQQQLQIINDPLVHARPSTSLPLVSLEHAVVSLTGEAYGSAAALARVSLLWSMWLAALLCYVWRCCQYAVALAAPSRAALADWVVLLLAPLLFSPWLEPYHCVPLLVAALLCIVVALDAKMMRRDRMAALVAVSTLGFCTIYQVPFAVRGLEVEAEFLVVVLVLAFVRPRLSLGLTSIERSHWCCLGPEWYRLQRTGRIIESGRGPDEK